MLTQCVGYGDATIRLAEPVRDALLARREPAGQQRAHEDLAWFYQQADGATSPLQLAGPPLRAWLEKAHHLAHSVSDAADTTVRVGRQRWANLECPSRHLLWDRARTLSREHRRYAEAAALFRRCIEQFGDDDYSWHYAGFNLERARQDPGGAETALRMAVVPEWPRDKTDNPGSRNPWWNSRLVTFLIGRGRTLAALEAWGAALDNVDPDCKRVADNPWLAKHLHRWVVRAWLEVGEVKNARRVFDEIPADIVGMDEQLKQLQWRLEDAEEAVQLVESVYPASTPPSDRWHHPQVPPGAELSTWSPGRVVAANRNGVVLVLAAMGPGGPERRVVRAQVSAKEWSKLAWCPPADAAGFVEVHVTRQGRQRIVPVTAAQPPWALAPAEDASA